MVGKVFKWAALCGAILSGAASSATSLPAGNALEVTITGIASAKGAVRLALCPPDAGFPDCGAKALRSTTLPIVAGQAHGRLTGIPAGTYAISVFHDANANGRLDTFLGIPREGYGFSGNPPFRPRAPRFDEAEIALAAPGGRADIKLRYIF